MQYFNPKSSVSDPGGVELALYRSLPGDLSILNPAPANDSDTVTVTDATAQRWNLKSIADLVPHAAEVKFGAPSATTSASIRRSAAVNPSCRPWAS